MMIKSLLRSIFFKVQIYLFAELIREKETF